MNENRRPKHVRTRVSEALLLAGLALFAGACTEGPTEPPPTRISGDCVWVNGEWVCP
jgi:hypothetical protein